MSLTPPAALLIVGLVAPAIAQEGVVIVEGPALALDGSTVEVDDVRIALQGLDVPALTKPGGQWPYQPAAFEAFQDLALILRQEASSWLRCVVVPASTEARSALPVGTCRSRQNLDVAQELIRRGRALSCPRQSLAYVDDEQLSARTRLPRSTACSPLVGVSGAPRS
jgi:endonuclease YncB( thermonuclease family)